MKVIANVITFFYSLCYTYYGDFMNTLITNIHAILSKQDLCIIAIDGKCCAGKTTLAHKLQSLFDCCIISMDDFFLQPHQRCPQRFCEAGGNIDYERFMQEVIKPLSQKQAFSYQVFDCSKQQLTQFIDITLKPLIIIEGTYCLHPYFHDIYDLKIFMDIDDNEQKARILKRPQHKHERFFNEWLPYEQHYFNTYHIKKQCHMVLNGGFYETN